MSLDNATVLKNLSEQRNAITQELQELTSRIQEVQTKILRLDGAIDVLTQIEQSNSASEPEKPQLEQPQLEQPTADE